MQETLAGEGRHRKLTQSTAIGRLDSSLRPVDYPLGPKTTSPCQWKAPASAQGHYSRGLRRRSNLQPTSSVRPTRPSFATPEESRQRTWCSNEPSFGPSSISLCSPSSPCSPC